MVNENAIKIPSNIVFFREVGYFVASSKSIIAIINPKYAPKLRCPVILKSKSPKLTTNIALKKA